MDIIKKIICVLVMFIFSITTCASADETINLENVIRDTARHIIETVSEPQVGSVGGEWAVLGLARSDFEVPDEYYSAYYNRVEEYVKEHGGKLHNRKYTEYSRIILTLTAIGKNPEAVAGYNLLTPLGDYEKTIWQGINGPVWALISLDSGGYEMPHNPDAEIQATREMYVKRILDCQLPDGGWSLSGMPSENADGVSSDPDITGMALQALSKYRGEKNVNEAIEKALNALSAMQDERGGFSSWGTANSESCVQVIVALCELGIAHDDSRFVKNGNTILDNLMTFYDEDRSFRHTADGSGVNLMSSEQAFYAVVAIKRASEGKNSLYSMSDAISFSESEDYVVGLKNKNADVKKMKVSDPGKTFDDITGHKCETAIKELASRAIINGKSSSEFDPESTVTRAEFAAVLTRGLGLSGDFETKFKDVSENDWFYESVNTACAYGIVNGISENEFNPDGTITREEAAVMVARAAKLCGMETEMASFAIRNVLSQFLDYVKAADWSQSSLAFCYKEGILSDEVMEINPKEAITRAEVASVIYNMLRLAKLM